MPARMRISPTSPTSIHRGLPKVRADAQRILDEMKERGVHAGTDRGAGRVRGKRRCARGTDPGDRTRVCAYRRRPACDPAGIYARDRMLLGDERPPAGRAAPCDRAPARDGRDRPPPEDAGRAGYRGERVRGGAPEPRDESRSSSPATGPAAERRASPLPLQHSFEKRTGPDLQGRDGLYRSLVSRRGLGPALQEP